MIYAFKKIIRKPRYYIILSIFFVLFFVLFNFSQNFPTLSGIISSSDLYTFGEKMKIILDTLLSFPTNFLWYQQVLMFVISLLGGINVLLTVYYWRNYYAVRKKVSVGISTLSILIGLLGVGCSACGSVLLAMFFGAGSTTFLLNYFPLDGLEIPILSILILLSTNSYILYRISRPNVCKL